RDYFFHMSDSGICAGSSVARRNWVGHDPSGERAACADDAGLVELVDDAVARGVASAAAVIVSVDGRVVAEHATGTVRAWDSPGVPAETPGAAVDADTRFDLASVTKPIVAAALLAELEARGRGPDLRVADVLEEFREPDLRHVTVRHLLTHTAGFAAEWFDRDPDPEGLRFRAGARPAASVDARHEYSCVGFIWVGFVAEALAVRSLDEVVRDRVLDPLGMTQAGYRPPAGLRTVIAATEFQPGRGLVHGEVHDETAWALGGVSGNAGLFGTARDLLSFAEALRCGGRLDGRRVLAPAVVKALVTPVEMPEVTGYRQALGLRVDEGWMRGLGRGTVGHTGFTGTGFATVPGGRRSVVFLTNRVHPTRSSTEILSLRERVVDAAALLGGRR
ncbi:MAG TPA: serine hydrolase domain-containing protein, partial [Agromyces sp.]|nr:serine hydrolase domain-containing protein [Agromyces sp.]